MERQKTRTREREPDYPDAPKFNAWNASRQKFTRRQFEDDLIVRAKDIPYETTPMGAIRFYVNPFIYPDRALVDWHSFVMDVQRHTGKHTHQGGVVIYVLEGSGYTIIEGEREEWSAGDLLLLPVKPGGVEHQFFNHDPDAPCRWIAAVHIPIFNQLGSEFTQKDYASEYHGGGPPAGFDPGRAVVQRPPAESNDTGDSSRDSYPSAVRVPADDPSRPARIQVFENGPRRRDELASHSLFDELLKLRDMQRGSWLRNGLTVVSGDYLPWESNPWGTMRWYAHPSLFDTCIRSHIVYEQRIGAGSHSGKVLHQGNSLVFVLSGSGYTVIDGEKYDWGPEDMIQLPARPPGVVFQHFNSSDDTEVRLLGFELNTSDMVGVDRGCGLEVVEPAPEFSARSE